MELETRHRVRPFSRQWERLVLDLLQDLERIQGLVVSLTLEGSDGFCLFLETWKSECMAPTREETCAWSLLELKKRCWLASLMELERASRLCPTESGRGCVCFFLSWS